MAWERSTRRATLPPDWTQRRAYILRRDPTCRLHLPGCTTTSTDCDHIGDRNNHSPANLRGVCTSCHKQHTTTQATAARHTTRRPAERHPGLR